MKLHIRAEDTIWKLQYNFSEAFPFLRIEFFKPAHKDSKKGPDQMLHPSTTVRKAYIGKEKTGILEFSPSATVGELEKWFIERFHLKVQVYRKSGDLWLETTATDNWTLEQQNKHGAESVEIIKEDEVPDYDLNSDNDD